ncbi:hypothetical protein AWC38_SpisGene7108 [Stylophora pistillata]|uniref:C-type lectin domain-containing protein n=1 Tax=Stylophora pistillata TaxID=50429 RepID=A0A2B4SI81_STYPI|nr:hypothetical protein AWC38_SpisGene7108 [Stylophora pistillata]
MTIFLTTGPYRYQKATGYGTQSRGKLNDKRSKRENNEESCDHFSVEANCSKCGFHGICERGSARISPWLSFALKTQRELQIDAPINLVQVLGAHNSYNNRASGYGDLDDCHWPHRADDVCIAFANQEFSFTDQLNMGMRNMEIDLWKCFNKIRMSHGNQNFLLGCVPWDKEFEDGMKEISDWTKKHENQNEILEIFFEDHTTREEDSSINQVIEEYFGDRVFTPSDLKQRFGDKWPNTRQLREMKRTIIFLDGNNHSARFLHSHFWSKSYTVKHFDADVKNCSFKGNSKDSVRIYSDSTVYGPVYNGIRSKGTIMDFKKYLLCGVGVLGADQINAELMKTAVFTWAEGEPKQAINESSCVMLSRDKRWYVRDCNEEHYYACVSKQQKNHWSLSAGVGKYSSPLCGEGMEFSVPKNGYQHQQLSQAAQGKTVWLNFTPFIPLLVH